MVRTEKHTVKFDSLFLAGVLALLGIGIVIIYSSSGAYAETRHLPSTFYLVNHLKKVLIALAAFMVGMTVDFRVWKKFSRPVLFIVIGMLVFLITSANVSGINGAKRWVTFAGMGLQPSEMAKVAVIFFLARFLTEKAEVMDRFKSGLLASLMMSGLVIILVLLQPNYSTAAIILAIVVAMIFTGGARFLHLAALSLAGIPLLGWLMVSSPYRLQRVMAFLKPGENLESSYQAAQAMISLGNGGIIGTGLGTSTQKLGYLPMPFTDTIFSILGEELGFFGTMTCLFLFALIIWRGLRIAFRSSDRFGSLMATGIIISISVSVIMHIGVCTGIFPTTGQPLPFVSYGGSALVAMMFFSGIILNISASPQEDPGKAKQDKKRVVHGAWAKQRMRFT